MIVCFMIQLLPPQQIKWANASPGESERECRILSPKAIATRFEVLAPKNSAEEDERAMRSYDKEELHVIWAIVKNNAATARTSRSMPS